MRGTIVGFQSVDYTSKKTNQPVKGVTLYLTVPSSDVIGRKVKEEFIKEDSSVFKVLRPYLDSDVDGLIDADVFIDYSVDKRANMTFTDICDLQVFPCQEKK